MKIILISLVFLSMTINYLYCQNSAGSCFKLIDSIVNNPEHYKYYIRDTSLVWKRMLYRHLEEEQINLWVKMLIEMKKDGYRDSSDNVSKLFDVHNNFLGYGFAIHLINKLSNNRLSFYFIEQYENNCWTWKLYGDSDNYPLNPFEKKE